MLVKIEFDLPYIKKVNCKGTNNSMRRLETYKEEYKDKIYGSLADKTISYIKSLDSYGCDYRVETMEGKNKECINFEYCQLEFEELNGYYRLFLVDTKDNKVIWHTKKCDSKKACVRLFMEWLEKESKNAN